jgi:hypothetical protein
MKGGSPGGYQGSDSTSSESTATNGHHQGSRNRAEFADVGVAIRAAYLRFKRRGLPDRLRPTLDAVVCLVSSYSRLEDYIAIAEVARFMWDVDEPTGWQRERARERLAELRAADICVYQPKRGRPKAGESGFATIGLPPIETHPGSGEDNEQKYTPGSRVKHPESARKAPGTGGHTEKDPEKDPEKAAPKNSTTVEDANVGNVGGDSMLENASSDGQVLEDRVRRWFANSPNLEPFEVDALFTFNPAHLELAFAEAVARNERYPSFLRRRCKELAEPRPAYWAQVERCSRCNRLTFDCECPTLAAVAS